MGEVPLSERIDLEVASAQPLGMSGADISGIAVRIRERRKEALGGKSTRRNRGLQNRRRGRKIAP